MRIRRPALGLLAAGAALGIVGVLPDAPDGIWQIGVTVAALGTVLILPTLVGRREVRQPDGVSRPERPSMRPLREGESYDTAVKLATVPNAPLANLWCQRLREQGIEAFSKSGASSGIAGMEGGLAANPWGAVEVWVGEHNVARARKLFPELA